MTDKDLAFRVVAEGLDVRNTLIAQVMTKVLYTCCYSALFVFFVLCQFMMVKIAKIPLGYVLTFCCFLAYL